MAKHLIIFKALELVCSDQAQPYYQFGLDPIILETKIIESNESEKSQTLRFSDDITRTRVMPELLCCES